VPLPPDSRVGRGYDPRPTPRPQPSPSSNKPISPELRPPLVGVSPVPIQPADRGQGRRDPRQDDRSSADSGRDEGRDAGDGRDDHGRWRDRFPDRGHGGLRPWPLWPRYYPSYWGYGPYWRDNYPQPYPQPYPQDWRDGGGVGVIPQEDWRDARDPALDNPRGGPAAPAAADDRIGGLGDGGVPQLPPDEVLGDGDLTPAQRKALEGSAEWRGATAALLRAWAEYAQAANRVLADVRRTAEYRKALADYKRAQARVDVVQAVPERLVPAADAAIQARRVVQSMERDALGRDAQVRSAQRRVDEAIDERNKVRDAVVGKLPGADRLPKRPRLLEDE
jgi:hypothetical protein